MFLDFKGYVDITNKYIRLASRIKKIIKLNSIRQLQLRKYKKLNK